MTVPMTPRIQFLSPVMREDLAWYNTIICQQGLRPVTVRMYADDYLRYLEFCMEVKSDHWSDETDERYFKHLVSGDTISLMSARRLVSGLRKGFVQRGFDPFSGARWQGFFRGIKLRAQAPTPKSSRVVPVSRRMVVEWAEKSEHGNGLSLLVARNKALILSGWTSGLSGSELQFASTARPSWRGMGSDGAWIARSALDKLFQETDADQSMRDVTWRIWFDGIVRLLSQEALTAKAPILRDDLIALVQAAEDWGENGIHRWV